MKETFSEELIRVINKRGVTNEVCARILDVSTATVERWIKGDTEPNHLIRLTLIKTLSEVEIYAVKP